MSEPTCCIDCKVENPAGGFPQVRMPDGRLYTRKRCRACHKENDRARKRRAASEEPRNKLRIAVFGDMHLPFASQEALSWAYRKLIDWKPTHVVQAGDLTDQFCASRFPHSKSHITPQEEFERAREQSVEFWARVQAAAPKAKCYQLTGNHDDRVLKRTLEKAPELEPFVGRSLREFMTFEGVETVYYSNAELVIGGIVFAHGYTVHGRHAPRYRRSTVVGHLHKAGVTYFADADGVYWELNVGCLIDLEAPVFDYRVSRFADRVTLGLGLIDEDGPRFVQFPGE